MSASLWAEPVYITGVPDWDQPALAAGQPAVGPWGAWCVPTATANIVGYYRDAGISSLIGDGTVFPVGGTFGVNADWQDDTADATGGARADLGWFYNTNDSGLGGSAIPSYRGTKLVHIEKGVLGNGGLLGKGGGYFPSHGEVNVAVKNYGADTMHPGLYLDFDTTGDVQSTHTYQNGFAEIMTEINAQRPLLGHFEHFNITRNRIPSSKIGEYDKGAWGDAPWTDPDVGWTDDLTGEVWLPNEGLGHTVTIAGYFDIFDAINPFVNIANAIIVHDNADGYLTALNKPLPLVLPWEGSPWAGLTEISDVPEPLTVSLMALGAVGLLGRRKRVKR